MTEQADWPPSRTDDPDVVEHSRSFEWVDEPSPVAVAPYSPGGADLPVQTGLEVPETGPDPTPDPTPVLDPDQ